MNIALLSSTGSVGKTSIANMLLLPRLERFGVVTITDGLDLIDALTNIDLVEDNAIIDVNVDSTGTFIKWMGELDMEIDLFLIPVLPDLHSQKRAISLLPILFAKEVHPSKVKIIFNVVEECKEIECQFRMLLTSDVIKNIHIDFRLFLPETDLYKILHPDDFLIALHSKREDEKATILAKKHDKYFNDLFKFLFEAHYQMPLENFKH